MFYFYIIASTICFLTGDYFAKLWVANDKWSLLTIILPFYLIASTLFLFALKKVNSLSFAILIGTLTGLIGGVCLGHLLFDERLNLPQYFGLGFAIIAIGLLTFPFESLSR
jgi:multidrug transporter EmrE-like cation transporter